VTDHTPTFADLCSAIVDGSLPVTTSGSMYEVNALELRRFLSRFRSTQVAISTDSQALQGSSDAQVWSSTTQTSVA